MKVDNCIRSWNIFLLVLITGLVLLFQSYIPMLLLVFWLRPSRVIRDIYYQDGWEEWHETKK